MKTPLGYRKSFMQLVNELCRVLHYPENPEELRQDEALVMEMSLEDIPFNVSHFLDASPDKIIIEAVFGDVVMERSTDILYRILHLNRELAESGAAALGYDLDKKKVIYSQQLFLENTSGPILLEKMTEICWRAQHWKQTYFLQDGQCQSGSGNSGPQEQFISLA